MKCNQERKSSRKAEKIWKKRLTKLTPILEGCATNKCRKEKRFGDGGSLSDSSEMKNSLLLNHANSGHSNLSFMVDENSDFCQSLLKEEHDALKAHNDRRKLVQMDCVQKFYQIYNDGQLPKDIEENMEIINSNIERQNFFQKSNFVTHESNFARNANLVMWTNSTETVHRSKSQITFKSEIDDSLPLRAKRNRDTVGVIVLSRETLDSLLELIASLNAEENITVIVLATNYQGLYEDLKMKVVDDVEVRKIEVRKISASYKGEKMEIDLYDLACKIKSFSKLFIGLQLWNSFIAKEEEENVITLLRAAFICDIFSIVFTTYEDIEIQTVSLDRNLQVVRNSLSTHVSPSFDKMKEALTYAKSKEMKVTHTMTLVKSNEGMYVNLTVSSEGVLDVMSGILPEFDELESNTTLSTCFSSNSKRNDSTSSI